MAIVETWDGENRRVYLHADTVNAVWDAVDLYREYRIHRRTVEAFRQWEPLLRMEGNIAKGGGRATPRYITMLDSAKIIPYDAAGFTRVAGEIITDDETSPYDYSTLTNPMVVEPSPAEAEIILVDTGGSFTPADRDAVTTLTAQQIRLMKAYGMVPGATFQMPPATGGEVLEDGVAIADVAGGCDTGHGITGRPAP